jgi:hypothetical protein
VEYCRAGQELGKERNQFLGFMDLVKGLSLWVETTEERAHKNLTPAPEPACDKKPNPKET